MNNTQQLSCGEGYELHNTTFAMNTCENSHLSQQRHRQICKGRPAGVYYGYFILHGIISIGAWNVC